MQHLKRFVHLGWGEDDQQILRQEQAHPLTIRKIAGVLGVEPKELVKKEE